MITPTLEQLNALHNFTVESQVQFYAPLAFEPPKRNGEKGEYYALGEDERKIFINSAEWTLCSYTFFRLNRHILILRSVKDNQ